MAFVFFGALFLRIYFFNYFLAGVAFAFGTGATFYFFAGLLLACLVS
jgi:hypothetical protein